MKKLLSILALSIAALLATSCEQKMEFIYDVTITGEANGNVDITFPDGSLNLDGVAALDFQYGNAPIEDTTKLKGKLTKTEQNVLAASDTLFNVTSAAGTYYVRIKGKVKESLTGIVIEVDKTFTNKQ